jgi:hypothetical protein
MLRNSITSRHRYEDIKRIRVYGNAHMEIYLEYPPPSYHLDIFTLTGKELVFSACVNLRRTEFSPQQEISPVAGVVDRPDRLWGPLHANCLNYQDARIDIY